MSLSLSCLKRLNLKEPILVVFLSSAGSEFQSLAPAIWRVFPPVKVLYYGTSRLPWLRRFLFWSLALLVRKPSSCLILGQFWLFTISKVKTNLRNLLLLDSVNSPIVFLIYCVRVVLLVLRITLMALFWSRSSLSDRDLLHSCHRCIHNRSLGVLFVCRSSDVSLCLESQQVYLRVLLLVKLFQLTVICEVPS